MKLADFIDMVWPPTPGQFIALRGYTEKGQPEQRPYTVWVEASDPERVAKVAAFVAECRRRRLACYCIPGLVSGFGRAGSADVTDMQTICIDIDTGDIDGTVRRLADDLGRPTMIIESGGLTPDGKPKRYVYWRLSRPQPVSKVCELRERLARAYGGDPSFGNAHQPIRIPTSTHYKAEPRVASITFFEEANRLDPFIIDARLPPLDPSQRSSSMGFQHRVSLDDLVMRDVGHGGTDINRFEAMTRMMGMMISNINDVDNREEVEREFGYFATWARRRLENIERDYSLRQHWYRLLARERNKRSGRAGYRPKFRPFRRRSA